MNGRSMTMLALAVACGLGAMYGTSRLLTKGKAAVEMQDVIVAARDLRIEEVLKPDLVKVVRMEKSAVPVGAFSQAKDLEDRWVTIGMLEGETIVDKKLAERGSPPGLVARIPKGMRAYTLDVNEQSGVSGFVLPTHRVDIVQIESSNQASAAGETVLQDVLVLAAGQTFTRPDDRSLLSRTITVALTPEQVETVAAAKARGPLTLSLRGLDDHVVVATKKKPVAPAPVNVTPEPVVAKAPEPLPSPPPLPEPPPAQPPARYVWVYRGADGGKKTRIDKTSDEPTAPTETLTAAQPPANGPPQN